LKTLVYLFIILIPFQDFFTGKTLLGYIGYSPSFIPLILLIIYRCHSILINKNFIKLFFYIFLLNFIYFFINDELIINGENVVTKSIKLFTLTIIFIAPIFLINYNKISYIRNFVVIAFFISLFPLCYSYFYSDMLDLNDIFHATSNGNQRPRGFAVESSLMGVQIVTLGLLVIYYYKNKYFRYIIFLIIILSLTYTDSKGGIACFTLAIIVTFLTFIKFSKIKTILFLIILTIISYYIYNFIGEKILFDIENFSSSSTRIILMVSTFLIILFNPFGVGFSGYLNALNSYIPESISLIPFQMNYDEVMSFINASSGQNISAKTILFNYAIYFGLPFLVLFYRYFKSQIIQLIQHTEKELFCNLIFIIIAISTYVDSINAYNITFTLGIIYSKFNLYKSKGIVYERV
jgi:hypothetical protein